MTLFVYIFVLFSLKIIARYFDFSNVFKILRSALKSFIGTRDTSRTLRQVYFEKFLFLFV